MTRRANSGFTMLELIVFIVIVAVALAGILLVMNRTVSASANPMARKQALVIAESVLDEILQKPYDDPDGTNAGETGRDTWDNVDDYNGKTQANFALPSELAGYTIAISVASGNAALPGVNSRRVTVTVTSPGGERISITGYRAQY